MGGGYVSERANCWKCDPDVALVEMKVKGKWVALTEDNYNSGTEVRIRVTSTYMQAGEHPVQRNYSYQYAGPFLVTKLMEKEYFDVLVKVNNDGLQRARQI